jgi:hypothetical protein
VVVAHISRTIEHENQHEHGDMASLFPQCSQATRKAGNAIQTTTTTAA